MRRHLSRNEIITVQCGHAANVCGSFFWALQYENGSISPFILNRENVSGKLNNYPRVINCRSIFHEAQYENTEVTRNGNSLEREFYSSPSRMNSSSLSAEVLVDNHEEVTSTCELNESIEIDQRTLNNLAPKSPKFSSSEPDLLIHLRDDEKKFHSRSSIIMRDRFEEGGHSAYVQEIVEGIRWHMEDCNNAQAVQFIIDSSSEVWIKIASSVLEIICDDLICDIPIYVYSLKHPISTSTEVERVRWDHRMDVNFCMEMYNFQDYANVLVPMDCFTPECGNKKVQAEFFDWTSSLAVGIYSFLQPFVCSDSNIFRGYLKGHAISLMGDLSRCLADHGNGLKLGSIKLHHSSIKSLHEQVCCNHAFTDRFRPHESANDILLNIYSESHKCNCLREDPCVVHSSLNVFNYPLRIPIKFTQQNIFHAQRILRPFSDCIIDEQSFRVEFRGGAEYTRCVMESLNEFRADNTSSRRKYLSDVWNINDFEKNEIVNLLSSIYG